LIPRFRQTTSALSSFDVATDALSWQTHLQNIHKYCVQYDMLSILSIPVGVDYSDPNNVLTHTEYKDAIEDWQELDDDDYFKWQEFLLRYSSVTEVESDAWLEDTLQLSLEKTLIQTFLPSLFIKEVLLQLSGVSLNGWL